MQSFRISYPAVLAYGQCRAGRRCGSSAQQTTGKLLWTFPADLRINNMIVRGIHGTVRNISQLKSKRMKDSQVSISADASFPVVPK